jgi:hypothetical protein
VIKNLFGKINLFGRLRAYISVNPQRANLIGIIILAALIPLTTIAALTMQNFIQHAGGLNVVKVLSKEGVTVSSTTDPNVLIDIDLTGTDFVLPDESKNVLGTAINTSHLPKLSLNTTISKDNSYVLTIEKPIYSFTLNANVDIKSDKGLVRVIFIDKNQKEYLVYEAYPLIGKSGSFNIDDACEETCALNSITPSYLKIQLIDATIRIKSATYIDSVKKLNANILSMGIKPYASALKTKRENAKIGQINNIIKKNGLKWTAGETAISKMTYADKKKLYANKDGTPVDNLPNLQGFEYYIGGVFETLTEAKQVNASALKTTLKTDSSSDLPAEWDWRSVHGENWMTSVKNQVGQTCWAYANIGVLEALTNLYYNDSNIDLDLSEQSLINCQSDLRASENRCAEGDVCPIQNIGVSDEECVPIKPNGIPEACESGCSNIGDRIWKISDHRTLLYESWTKDMPRRIPINNLNGDEKIMESLIKYGPMIMDGAIDAHAMVLVGYRIDPTDNRPIYILKNSWGSWWGKKGYTEIKVDPLLYNSQAGVSATYIITPLISPKTWNQDIKCTDKDKDGYCNWGISEQMPDTCPSTCKPQKDCNDSDFSITTQGCILSGVSPTIMPTNTPTSAPTPTLTLTPIPTPNILKAIYIENKDTDGSTGGSEPTKIIISSEADLIKIPWKINDLLPNQAQAQRIVQITLIGETKRVSFLSITQLIRPLTPTSAPTLTPTHTPTPTLTPLICILRGDVNRDGKVSAADMTAIERIILNLDPAVDEADANGDGTIDEADVDQVVRFIMGLDKNKMSNCSTTPTPTLTLTPIPTRTPTPTPTPTPTICRLRGDVNRDGKVSAADTTAIERIILNLDPAVEEADANNDGVINEADVDQVVRFIMKYDKAVCVK